MKKSVLILIMLAGCLLLGSCAVSADQMLQDFNGQIYEDKGDGTYVTNNGKPSISYTLIERPVYSVNAKGYCRIEIDKDFFEYQWTFINNKTNEKFDLGKSYIVYVQGPLLKLIAGGDYTLQVLVKSRNNLLFTDSATIKVVK